MHLRVEERGWTPRRATNIDPRRPLRRTGAGRATSGTPGPGPSPTIRAVEEGEHDERLPVITTGAVPRFGDALGSPHGLLAQPGEHRACNAEVRGSIPRWSTPVQRTQRLRFGGAAAGFGAGRMPRHGRRSNTQAAAGNASDPQARTGRAPDTQVAIRSNGIGQDITT